LVTPSAQSRKVPTFTESPEAGGVMYVLLPPVLHCTRTRVMMSLYEL
jgi:hypothetical protein